jgi:hypothetical protein
MRRIRVGAPVRWLHGRRLVSPGIWTPATFGLTTFKRTAKEENQLLTVVQKLYGRGN